MGASGVGTDSRGAREWGEGGCQLGLGSPHLGRGRDTSDYVMQPHQCLNKFWEVH